MGGWASEIPMTSGFVNRKKAEAIRWLHYALALFFLVYWVMPLAYTGITGKDSPQGGRYLNHLWRVSALFIRRIPYWDNYYYQVKTEEGGDAWVDVPDGDISPMRPFGYATRAYRALGQGGGDPARPAVMRDLALFIKKKHEALHPEAGRVTEMRYVRVRYRSGSRELTQTREHWQIPPLAEVPEGMRVVVNSYKFYHEGEQEGLVSEADDVEMDRKEPGS